MKKSRENRVNVSLTTTIGAGNFMFEGLVGNISRNGFMVTDLPVRFDPTEKNISTIIVTPKGHFKLNVRSTWVKATTYSKDVGFEILSYGSRWMELLDELDPITRRTDSATDWVV